MIHASHRYKNRAARHAFTLIELAIVLALVSLVLGLVLRVVPERNCLTETQEQLHTIRQSIDEFVRANNYYPMPAGRALGASAPLFGSAVTTAASPLTDVVAGSGSSPNRVLSGALPFATLGLGSRYAADCWGNKFSYYISELLTNPANYMSGTAIGKIQVNTGTLSSPSALTTTAAYAVISHGADALGASPRNNTTGNKRYCVSEQSNATITRIDKENCDIANLVLFSSQFNDGRNARDFFDDLVIYAERTGFTGCNASVLTWNGCSANVGVLQHGASTILTNVNGGQTGSANVTCINGTPTITSSTCTPVMPNNCAGQPISWGTFCNGVAPTLNVGTSTTVTNTSSGYTGSVTVICTDGVMSQTSPTCTPECQSVALNTYRSNRSRATWTNYVTLDVCAVGGVGGGRQFSVTTDLSGTSWLPNQSPNEPVSPDRSPRTWNLTHGSAYSLYYRTITGSKTTGVEFAYNGGCSVTIRARYEGGASNWKYAQAAITAVDSCKVDGGWSAWSSYYCNATECNGGGQMTRYRSCTSPAPKNGGANCVGSPTDTEGQSCLGTDSGLCADSSLSDCISSCFLGEVEVTLADGTRKRIDALEVGDAVRGRTGINRVTRTASRETTETLYGLNGGAAFVTGGHPFWTEQGWKAIDPSLTPREAHGVPTTALAIGDVLQRDDGSTLTITAITPAQTRRVQRVFNPSVDGDHTYFAGGLLVHNKLQCNNDGFILSY